MSVTQLPFTGNPFNDPNNPGAKLITLPKNNSKQPQTKPVDLFGFWHFHWKQRQTHFLVAILSRSNRKIIDQNVQPTTPQNELVLLIRQTTKGAPVQLSFRSIGFGMYCKKTWKTAHASLKRTHQKGSLCQQVLDLSPGTYKRPIQITRAFFTFSHSLSVSFFKEAFMRSKNLWMYKKEIYALSLQDARAMKEICGLREPSCIPSCAHARFQFANRRSFHIAQPRAHFVFVRPYHIFTRFKWVPIICALR